jgi:hypothetical protein
MKLPTHHRPIKLFLLPLPPQPASTPSPRPPPRSAASPLPRRLPTLHTALPNTNASWHPHRLSSTHRSSNLARATTLSLHLTSATTPFHPPLPCPWAIGAPTCSNSGTLTHRRLDHHPGQRDLASSRSLHLPLVAQGSRCGAGLNRLWRASGFVVEWSRSRGGRQWSARGSGKVVDDRDDR